MNVPTIGQLIKEHAKRDAIHVSVAPVELTTDCVRGQDVYLLNKINELGYHLVTSVDNGSPIVGIIDPYLKEEVLKAGMFVWLFLYPNTTTSLRHVWSHPLFSR